MKTRAALLGLLLGACAGGRAGPDAEWRDAPPPPPAAPPPPAPAVRVHALGSPVAFPDRSACERTPAQCLGPADLKAVLDADAEGLAGCARAHVQAHGEFPGRRVLMRWRVLPDGRTTDVGCVEGPQCPSTFAACAAQRIEGWRFRVQPVDGELLQHPLTF